MRITNHLFSISILTLLSVYLSSCNTKVNESCGVPDIKNYPDTLHFITTVRNYIAEKADIGFFPNSYCADYFNTPLNDADVCKFIQIFEKDSGVTSCGLSAYIMTKILFNNGIRACIYNYGPEDTEYRHAVCLVQYQNKWIFCDPYFNYTLVDEAAQPLDFFETVKLIKQKQFSKIKIETDTVLCDLVINSKSFSSLTADNVPEECRARYEELKSEIKSVAIWKKKEKIYFNYNTLGCRNFMGGLEKELIKIGKTPDFREAIIIKSNSIISPSDLASLNAQIDSALAH